MQVRANITYQIPKIVRAIKLCERLMVEHSEIITKRLKIIAFYDKYGKDETKKHFSTSKSTVYNWKKDWKEHGLKGLIPSSRAPKNKRKSRVSPLIEQFVKEYRNEHPRVGQEVIKAPLDKYCEQEEVKTVSTPTIGRILKELKRKGELREYIKMSYNGRTGKVSAVQAKKRRKKKRRKGYKPQAPGDLVQIDTVAKFDNGIKSHIATAIDVKTRFAFAVEYRTLNSLNAKDFMEKLRKVAPFEVVRIQTDNGLEFERFFREYVEGEGIIHFHNYPRSPKSNAYIERFNRTIQEQFVDWNLDLLEDTQKFNEALMDWLLWYNTERGHRSLNMETPMDCVLRDKFGDNFRGSPETLKKSNMLRYHTPY